MLFSKHFPRSAFPPSPPCSVISEKLIDHQASPPLESDDYCSACKGQGEFVCCDNCPRVYHFLCCDPPRLEPPTGSFLCNECEAKENAAGAPVTDAFMPFGPLLKQLRITNTRAFTLPKDISDYFEGVSTRKDGSYGEEVKKYPL